MQCWYIAGTTGGRCKTRMGKKWFLCREHRKPAYRWKIGLATVAILGFIVTVYFGCRPTRLDQESLAHIENMGDEIRDEVRDEIRSALARIEDPIRPRLDKMYPLGYVLFHVGTGPDMAFEAHVLHDSRAVSGFEVDWNSLKVGEITSERINFSAPTITNRLTGAAIRGVRFSYPVNRRAKALMFRFGDTDIYVESLGETEYGVAALIGFTPVEAR